MRMAMDADFRLRVGAEDYLIKPFSARELAARVDPTCRFPGFVRPSLPR